MEYFLRANVVYLAKEKHLGVSKAKVDEEGDHS